MNRRNISRRLERLEGQESPVGTGGRMANVEYDDEVPDGTLIRLPRSDRGDHVSPGQSRKSARWSR
jgi:hypothetical protein